MKKYSKLTRSLRKTSLCLLLALPASLFADTLEFKDGTKIEGKIVAEDAESVSIETNIRNIKETKKYPRTDIATISKLTPDQIAFDVLKPLETSRDLLSPEEYDAIIKKRIEPFLEEHPTSPLKPEAEKLLAMYEQERARARDGERKYKNEWIPADDFANRGYLIMAEVFEDEFKQQLQASDIPSAMRAFSSLESGHVATMNYHDSVITAKTILPRAKDAFTAKRVESEKALADWTKRLQTDRPENRPRIKAALQREQAELDRKIKAEQAMGIKWITPHPTRAILNNGAYSILEKLAASELQRLEGVRLPSIKQAAEAVETAVAAISKETPTEADLASAEAAINKAAPVLKGSTFVTTFNNRLTRERTEINRREQARKDEERKKIEAANTVKNDGKELKLNPFATGSSSSKRASSTGSKSSGGSSTQQTSSPGGGGGGPDFSGGGGGFLKYALMGLGVIAIVFLVMQLKKRKANG